jgi:predicted MFS family arabinose efflux permease
MIKSASMPQASSADVRLGRATFAGLCALLVGIGLARFAYSPLIPALIDAHWFTPDQAAYLGAANLFGYLVGVVSSGWVARGRPAAPTLRAMMLTTALSLFACTLDLGFSWFFVWRAVSGFTGGVIMLLAPPTVLAHTPSECRGLVGGAMFTGVGLGVAASGTLMPLLLDLGGARSAWVGLGSLALVLTIAAWGGWPPLIGPQPAPIAGMTTAPRYRPAVLSLHAEYALNVIGLVPHMIFLVDFVARGLGGGLQIAAQYWVVYGVGATLGPLLAGRLADGVGFTVGLRLALLAQAFAIALPAFSSQPAWLVVSSAGVGALTIGIVPLVLGRVHELVHEPDAQRRVWGHATIGFALAQALAGYGFSYLFSRSGSYTLLFGLGASALAVAVVLDLLVSIRDRASPLNKSIPK